MQKVISSAMMAMPGLLGACTADSGAQQALPPIVVPPGAILLAYGSPLPPFYTTHTSETLFIYDESEQQVVSVTRTPEIPSDAPIAPIDLGRLGVTLDPAHHYRVYGAGGAAPVAPQAPAVMPPTITPSPPAPPQTPKAPAAEVTPVVPTTQP
jgi:hypothetical protein